MTKAAQKADSPELASGGADERLLHAAVEVAFVMLSILFSGGGSCGGGLSCIGSAVLVWVSFREKRGLSDKEVFRHVHTYVD